MRKFLKLLVMVAFVTACGTDYGTVLVDGGVDTATVDIQPEAKAWPADETTETHPWYDDLPKDDSEAWTWPTDVPAAETADWWAPEPGSAGYPCSSGDDCQEGFCIQAPDGKVCTVTCTEECPFDWACLLYTPSRPDQIFLCLPQFTDLCKPCLANADCWTDGVDAGQACVTYGEAGSFCGAACQADDDCPEGYWCEQVQDTAGATVPQCQLAGGECECTQRFVDLAAGTQCFQQNEWGMCVGERSCKAEGLTECSAAAPADELCDGVDNDCDEEIDEGTGGGECLVMNQFGSAPASTNVRKDN